MILGRSFAGLIGAVFVTGLLAACTQHGTLPSPSGSSRPASVSPTSAPTQAATPSARPPLGCHDLASDSAVSAAFGAEASATPAAVDAGLSGGVIENIFQLSAVSLTQAGGIVCGWNLGGGGSDAFFTARFLPDAASVWATGVPGSYDIPRITGWADQAAFGCIEADGEYCVTEALVGSVWVETVAVGQVGALDARVAGIEALDKGIVATVQAAGVPGPPWTAPPHPALACSDFIADGSTVAGISGLKLSATPNYSADRMTEAALAQVGGVGCEWFGSNGEVMLVYLPGGAWSWSSHPMPSNQSLSVASLSGVGDQAAGGCSTVIVDCSAQTISGSTRIGLRVASGSTGVTVTLAITAQALRDLLARIG